MVIPDLLNHFWREMPASQVEAAEALQVIRPEQVVPRVQILFCLPSVEASQIYSISSLTGVSQMFPRCRCFVLLDSPEEELVDAVITVREVHTVKVVVVVVVQLLADLFGSPLE